MTGRVKWFDGKKGFGFLTPDDGTPEVFVHHTQIKMTGYRNLETGQAVEFEVESGEKGLRAVNVKSLNTQTPKHPNTQIPKLAAWVLGCLGPWVFFS